MKKTIRLSESDLRNIISEAINELDWRTVTNAANKARANVKDLATVKGLRDLTNGEYSELTYWLPDHLRYITDKGNGYDGKRRLVNWDDEVARRAKQANNLSKFASDAISKHFDDNYGEYGNHSYYNYYNGIGNEFPELRRDTDYGHPVIFNPKFDDVSSFDPSRNEKWLSKLPPDKREEELKWFDKAKEMNDFYHGKSEYQKGKGWVNKNDKLDESIRRAIRKYLK